ncbi:hypothetical protein CBR_g23493 [Chara braunii]|uniref:Myb-like domain-containing protein n=1 Tax=Chara braunii TaxID=69332 RepID=A0A388L4E4_CHABU|nr:hypothetical protein CBR_g23493 [Chara braunii]|eukprot:GBG77167.1 hypothetical protein CBR_g23493 [Chara braunii]
MHVGAQDTIVDNDNGGPEDSGGDDGANDHDEEDEDAGMEIRPLGRKRGVRSATKKCSEARAGRKGKKAAEDTSAGEGSKSRDFWSVDHMIALVRAKRDQDVHLAGLGHNYGRMKSRTWKCDDTEKRKEKESDFRMGERVYREMEAMTKADHTVHLANLADTGADGSVQMGGSAAGQHELVASEGGGEGQDDEAGLTRNSTFSGGSGGGAGNKKNVRQQTFEAITDMMDKHGQWMATTVDTASKRQCSILTRRSDILEQEVDVQSQHYEKAD